MNVAGVIDRVRVLLQDPTGIRWSDTELLNAIAEAQQFVANVRPDATSTVIDLVVSAGTFFTTLPSTSRRVLDVLGTSNGDTVTNVKMSVIDRHAPTWRTESGAKIKHYIYEDRDPTRLYVYPKPTADTTLRVLVSSNPSNTVSLTGTLSVDDSYVASIVDLTAGRAFEKESSSASFSKAGALKQSAMDRMKIISGADASNSPQANEVEVRT